ncbi:hypothetical protein BESB_076650 [Besnoitia besnoiti]|uniref:tRNA-intron lyase n=1 Tax=Besnoitia besnoiti TaxID=94643 RepID=A0A2A9M4N7_BESBE|nr:hypothetical protein BESB_076650 [Besnoitia besnoiti]PFH33448.1 hypothetical protein BESB_076650 [Besnoitia besnoiti]
MATEVPPKDSDSLGGTPFVSSHRIQREESENSYQGADCWPLPQHLSTNDRHLASLAHGAFMCTRCLAVFAPRPATRDGEEGSESGVKKERRNDSTAPSCAQADDETSSARLSTADPRGEWERAHSAAPSSGDLGPNTSLLFSSFRLRDAAEIRRLLPVQLEPAQGKSRRRRRPAPSQEEEVEPLPALPSRKTPLSPSHHGPEKTLFLLSASQLRALLRGKHFGKTEASPSGRDGRGEFEDSRNVALTRGRVILSGNQRRVWLQQKSLACPEACSGEAVPVLFFVPPGSLDSSARTAPAQACVEEAEAARSRVFLDLHAKGFFVRDGLAYGGDWLLYPLPPSVCHATALVFVLRSPRRGGAAIHSQAAGANTTKNEGDTSQRSMEDLARRSACASTGEGGAAVSGGVRHGLEGACLPLTRNGCQGVISDAFSLDPASLVRMQRLAATAKKAAVLAIVEMGTSGPPVYAQLDRLTEQG